MASNSQKTLLVDLPPDRLGAIGETVYSKYDSQLSPIDPSHPVLSSSIGLSRGLRND
jgi:hypothetical protein